MVLYATTTSQTKLAALLPNRKALTILRLHGRIVDQGEGWTLGVLNQTPTLL